MTPVPESIAAPVLSQDDLFKDLKIRHVAQMQASSPSLQLTGYLLIATAVVFAAVYLHAAFLSKMLPRTGLAVLDMVAEDRYFCYLVPLVLLPTGAVLYLNWLAITHFRQN